MQIEKEIFIFIKSILLTRIWFVVSDFSEFPKHHMEKESSGHLYFYKKPELNSVLSKHFSQRLLRKSLIKQFFCTEFTSVSLFCGGTF